MVLLIILQCRKRISTRRVGVVVQSAPAEVGNIEAGPDGVLVSGPHEDLIQGDVILCLQTVALGAATREGAQNHDPWTWIDAFRRRVLAGGVEAELIEPLLRNQAAMINGEQVLACLEIP